MKRAQLAWPGLGWPQHPDDMLTAGYRTGISAADVPRAHSNAGVGWPAARSDMFEVALAVEAAGVSAPSTPVTTVSGASEPAGHDVAAPARAPAGSFGDEPVDSKATATAEASQGGVVDVSRETTAREAAPALVDVFRETTVPDGGAGVVTRIAPHVQPLPRPTRTRVVTVANQKGGVGKTTTTVNLAAALALHGAQVLVIDLDPQGNASTALGVDHRADVPSVYDVLVEGRPLHEVVTATPEFAGLFCAPATIDLAGAEIELVSLVAREMRLQRALNSYQALRVEQNEPPLDYVFIDCPPSLGLLTVNALVAAAEVLIPIQCEYYALEGVGQLVNNVELVKAHLNPDLHISTIVLTMYDARTRLAAQVADEVRTHFTEVVLRTTIPRSVRISEAPSYGQTVMTYDPTSTGALSYLEAAREIAFRGVTDSATEENAK